MAKFYNHPAYNGFIDRNSDYKYLEKFEKQFDKKGFDDSVTWSLDVSIAKFILPRLKRYIKLADKIIVIEPRFRKALDRMIRGFTILAEDNILTRNDYRKVHIAFVELSNFHNHLWW